MAAEGAPQDHHRVLSLETVQRDLTELVAGKDAEIEHLQAQVKHLMEELEHMEEENKDLKQQLAERFLVTKSLQQQLQQQSSKSPKEGLESDAVASGAPTAIGGDSLDAGGRSLPQSHQSLSCPGSLSSYGASGQPAMPGDTAQAASMPPTSYGASGQPTLPSDIAQTASMPLASYGASGQPTLPSNIAQTASMPLTSYGASGQPAMPGNTPQAASMPTTRADQARTNGAGGEKVVRGAVTEGMLDWLADNVPVKEWKPLARQLGVPHQKCEDMVAAYPNSPRDQRFQVYYYWKMTQPQLATVDNLLKAMEQKKLRLLARQFGEFNRRSGSEGSLTGEHWATSLPYRGNGGNGNGPVQDDFQRFMEPFIKKGELPALEEELNGSSQLTEKQMAELGIPSTQSSKGAALRHMCRAHYAEKKTDSEYDRCTALWKFIEVCNVRDTFKKFKKRGGVIGPMEKDGKLSNLGYSTNQKIDTLLSQDKGTWSWKELIDELKAKHPYPFASVDLTTISQWEQTQKGAKNVLEIWKTTTENYVHTLYDLAVQNGRFDIAEALE